MFLKKYDKRGSTFYMIRVMQIKQKGVVEEYFKEFKSTLNFTKDVTQVFALVSFYLKRISIDLYFLPML